MNKIKGYAAVAICALGISLTQISSSFSQQNISRNTPLTESITQSRTKNPVKMRYAKTAIKSFSDYLKIYVKNKDKFWVFSPNLDPCFYYRLDEPKTGSNNIDIGNEASYQVSKIRAKTLNIPDYDSLSNNEFSVFLKSNYLARYELLKSDSIDHYIVIKHFPGGNVEATEQRMVFFDDSLSSWRSQLEYFKNIIDSDNAPDAVMMSHGSYPKISFQLQSGSKITSNFTTHSTPASLNPFIIKGLLKNEFGYGGIVVSDWANMGALDSYIHTHSSHLREKIGPYSNKTIKIILAIDAGLDFLLGSESDGILETNTILEMDDYLSNNPSFAKIFDELIEKNLFHIKKTTSLLADWRVPAVSELSIEDKLGVFLGFNTENPELKAFSSLTNTFNFNDSWNRNGILLLLFRYYYVSSASGSDLCNPQSFSSLKEWLFSLNKTDEFWRIYDSIDWNGADSQSTWTDILSCEGL